ncbi:MAG TPA: hypothetical protein VGR95_21825 [Thermoanaerobaculia bacterium]|nr:hypothetical protein [Thermoanaerobaculia bacterium]
MPVFALDENRDSRTANNERDRHTVIDDVVRMSQAGVSDESIIRFIHQSRDGYVVNADTIIALNDAHVSKSVINALMDGAYDRGDHRDGGDRVVQERVVVQPAPYYGYYGFYDPYWYDPFWYAPRLSIGFGFGGHFGGYRGGHFGGHRGHR